MTVQSWARCGLREWGMKRDFDMKGKSYSAKLFFAYSGNEFNCWGNFPASGKLLPRAQDWNQAGKRSKWQVDNTTGTCTYRIVGSFWGRKSFTDLKNVTDLSERNFWLLKNLTDLSEKNLWLLAMRLCTGVCSSYWCWRHNRSWSLGSVKLDLYASDRGWETSPC